MRMVSSALLGNELMRSMFVKVSDDRRISLGSGPMGLKPVLVQNLRSSLGCDDDACKIMDKRVVIVMNDAKFLIFV